MDRKLTLKKSSTQRFPLYKRLKYAPPLYSFLSDEEWLIIDQWFLETEEKKMFGECGIPLVSILQAFIMGNEITNVLQLGHYAGYSTLMLGFMLRKMNIKTKFITVDIDEFCCSYTQDWVNKANLQEYVTILHGSSTDSHIVQKIKDIFKGELELVFIDSSHQYRHTVNELDIYFNELIKSGLIILHDSSKMAASYDSTKEGGVNRAIAEWHDKNPEVRMISLNADISEIQKSASSPTGVVEYVYKDQNGICIIQK